MEAKTAISSSFVTLETFLAWHDWARALAFMLLALGLLYAVLQFVLARSPRRIARMLSGGSLRTGLVVGLTLAGALPALTLALLLSERSAHLRHDRMAIRLEETAAATSRSIDQFIDKHVAAVTSTASSVSATGDFGSDSLTQSLLRYHDVYTDFLTMLSADSGGNIVAATSNMTGVLAPAGELTDDSVSDRDYFKQAMATGSPYVSNVFQGRGFGSDPIIAVSAPLYDSNGRNIGIVEGSLNLHAFTRLDDQRPHVDASVLILADQNGRVIYSSPEAGLEVLESIATGPLPLSAANAEANSHFTYVAESGLAPGRYLAVSSPTAMGWAAYVRLPLNQVAQQMAGDYQVAAAMLLLAIVLSLLLAGGIVRRVSGSLNDVNDAVASFRIDGKGEEFQATANTPEEFHPLFEQMRRRSGQLRLAHKRLNKSIKAGERLRRKLTRAATQKDIEIAERTEQLEEANSVLSELSRSDALTDIANRREFDSFEMRIWRNGARDKTPVAVIMMDIDYFKIYNDNLGHQQGDKCLIAVAQLLEKQATRPDDLVARYGGEEFGAILGGATVAEALIVAERMRRTVCNSQIPHPGSSHKVVSISAGVASAIPSSGDRAESLIKAADEALYYAKAAGKNCVVYSRDGEYVTYDPDAYDNDATNVISILIGKSQ